MDLRITLAPDGGLRLLLPTNRHLDVGMTASTMHFIRRILMDAKNGKPALADQQPGYIGEFPTQHIIDIWRKQDEAQRAEAKKVEFKEKGIDLEALDFRL